METNYNYAYVYLNEEIKKVTLNKNIKGILNKIVFVGDHVKIINNEIIEILPRKNTLSRNKVDFTKNSNNLNETIIATNISLALIIASPNNPKLHPRFIDRYIILLSSSLIPYKIVINKSDLLDDESKKIINDFKNNGEDIILTNTITKEGIDELKEIINGKQVIFVGQSGVGKSSLASILTNDDAIKSKSIGDKTKRGRHTTTKSTLYHLNENTFIIDSPGIRAISLKHLSLSDITSYFKEFEDYPCKYKDCHHLDEPTNTCGVKKALKEGKISKSRYESYEKLIKELK